MACPNAPLSFRKLYNQMYLCHQASQQMWIFITNLYNLELYDQMYLQNQTIYKYINVIHVRVVIEV